MYTNGEKTVDAKTQRNRFIDLLKGILIIFVIILHFPVRPEIQSRLLFPFWINQTVPCFMFLSGYTFARSFQKRQIENFEQAYHPKMILEKLIRFSTPYTIAFIAEWITFRIYKVYLTNIRTYGILAFFMDYLSGGKGQGSYYFPIIIQLLFLFPVVYFIIKKYHFNGLIALWCANGLYEILKVAYRMNDAEYRLLSLRYLFVIAAGCYCCFSNEKKSRSRTIFVLFCMGIGIFFTYLFSYTDYTPKIMTYWKTTSFLTGMFIVPVLGWLVHHVHWGFKPLEIIGKASFNIFLIQMIYYNFADKIYALIPSTGLQLLFNIANCVTVGVIFYLLENRLTKWIIEKLNRADPCL